MHRLTANCMWHILPVRVQQLKLTWSCKAGEVVGAREGGAIPDLVKVAGAWRQV